MYDRQHLKFSAIVGCCLLIAATAMGQVITGSMDGSVRDASGAVLPGATVTLTSPELPAGPRVFITDQEGQYRFRNLAPGTYALRVELAGFGTYIAEGIPIAVGGNIEQNITLKLASVAETVTVTGESPVIDTRKSGLSTNYDDEYMENTPLRRFSMFDFTKAAPGMSATRPAAADSTRVAAYGSSVDENMYLMDGTDYTAPVSGAAWPWPDTDTIEEIEIISLGASAEYSVPGGAVFNAVTKQGTNNVRVDASFFTQFDGLTASPVKLDCNCPDGQTGFSRDQFTDFTLHGGAPIIKDKMWIYGGYQRQRDRDRQPGTDPRFSRRLDADRFNYKFTWQVTENIKFMSTFHNDYWTIPQTPTTSLPFESTVNFNGNNPSLTFGDITHVLSDNTFYDVRVSGFFAPSNTGSENGNFGQSQRNDVATGVVSGGRPFSGNFNMRRTAIHGKLSHYATDFLGADHDFKFGAQGVLGKHAGHYGYTNDIIYYDYDGAPYYAYTRERYNYGGKFTNVGGFAEDLIHLGDRATVQVGVRFDRFKAISQTVKNIGANGEEVGPPIEGLGTLYTTNNTAPRVGFNIKLDQDGKSVLRGNFGIYYRQPITSELNGVHPGQTPFTLVFFDPATGGFTDVASVTDPLANVRINPNTKSPRTKQFSIGVDHELARDVAVSFTYIRKDEDHFNGWQVLNAEFGQDVVTLDNGQQLEVFPIVTDPSDRIFDLGNQPRFFTDYDGIQLQFIKRLSDNWKALFAYNFANGRGLLGSNNAPPSSSQETRARGSSIGRDPNDFTNATGDLLNDRTHTFTVQGSYEIPSIDLLIGANYRHLTGKPYAARARVRLPQGSRSIFIEPPGSRRLSSQNLLDLRISKIFRFGPTGKFEFLVDIFNLFNDSGKAEESIVTRNIASDNFAVPDSFVAPRRAMFGIKFAY